MGIGTAIATAFGASAGSAAAIGAAIDVAAVVGGTAAMSEQQRKAASKAAAKQKNATAVLAEQNKDKLIVTPKGITKKNARTALVVGSPRGILSTEDQTATSGRGTLLGN